MAGRANPTQDLIERIAQDIRVAGLDDLSELGKIDARLERHQRITLDLLTHMLPIFPHVLRT